MREDLEPAAYGGPHAAIYDFFDAIDGEADWRTLEELATTDLAEDLRRVADGLTAAGFREIPRGHDSARHRDSSRESDHPGVEMRGTVLMGVARRHSRIETSDCRK